MKLHYLRLENFRQYRGVQELAFATDKTRNITMIWGGNGAGKTTLLNAFLWSLYGTFTEDFENPDEIYNLDAWETLPSGERMTVAVELEFENGGQVFTVRRESRFQKNSDGMAVCEQGAEVSLKYRDESGRSYKSGNPGDHIEQILPKRLYGFFFFDGEQIEEVVHSYEGIDDSIKTVLGLAVVERAIKHLPKAIRKFEDDLRKHGTDEQREAATALTDLEVKIENWEEELEESRKEVATFGTELSALDEKLRGSEKSRELQRRREELTADEAKRRSEIDEIQRRIDLLVRESGLLAFGDELFSSIRELYVDKRERKELPAPVKIDFIEDLLEDGTCICGASLSEGSSGHQHILDWKQRAGLAEVEERWVALHADAGHMETRRRELAGQLDALLGDRLAARKARDLLAEQISEVSSQLQSHSLDEVASLEDARVAIEKRRSEELRKQGRIESDLARLMEEKRRTEQRLERARSVEAKAALAQRRVSVTREALELLKASFDIRKQHTRTQLDEEIKRIYSMITFKPNVPVVDENFRLELHRPNGGGVAAKSAGENQILSLSFVGALASIARARFEETSKGSGGNVRGGIYPIVADAIFGKLDRNYQRDVALELPALAEQIILINSSAQGAAVLEHVKSRIGRSYVITYATPKDDVAEDFIMLNNESYPYIVPSSDGSEYAELTEAS